MYQRSIQKDECLNMTDAHYQSNHRISNQVQEQGESLFSTRPKKSAVQAETRQTADELE
jgi:hypothetical protein